MSLTPGLNPNLRQLGPDSEAVSAPDQDIIIQVDENGDTPEFDDNGAILRIDHGDGSVTVSLDGKPLNEARRKDTSWFGNLVEDIEQDELSRICDDLLRGIDNDLESRKEWIEELAQGIRVLGFKIEIPGLQGAADGAPVEGMSKVRHPLLQEAVLRFQANARSELLPVDGPVKVRNDNNNATIGQDTLANALERDLNHYLTITASEYYPDTDRMLLMLGFGGLAFKKVYFCPLRNRPVSETVDADDLIVNDATTDIHNAKRITHRTMMRPSTVKRLQILGVYRDIELSTPLQQQPDAVQLEKKSQQGVTVQSTNPDDRDREIYECYCELDIKGFEHKIKSKETGLEIPYRVTIDVSSKQILAVVRNYDEDAEDLPEAKINIVPYIFVPGFGFYPIGLLHILGNTTNAITAAWREMLDAGMYANFPGFLYADTGARQNTNIFRVPPGGGAQVKTGGAPIQQMVMPLPYKDISTAFAGFIDNMAQTGMRVGGTAEQPVGEGRADAPVGTTLALIEQATKVLNSVHKRMHAAQCEEFRLLVDCFKEHPESFWQRNKKPAKKWDEETFLKALDDCELSPQADPNTSSQIQRAMKLQALKQLSAASPSLYDPIAIDTECIKALGFANPQQFFAPASAQAKPPPQLIALQQKGQADTMTAQARMLDAQSKAAETKAKVQEIAAGANKQVDTPVDVATAKARLMDAKTARLKVHQERAEIALSDANQAEDRQSKEKLELLQMAKELIQHPQGASIAEPAVKEAEKQ